MKIKPIGKIELAKIEAKEAERISTITRKTAIGLVLIIIIFFFFKMLLP
jgi:hypothetical protein